MRASDGDRDRVAEVLREHYAQGRLTVEEFDERLEQLYASRTYGELATLTSDLPDVDLGRLPAPAPRSPERRDIGQAQRKGLTAMWATWGTASGINWAIWLILGVTDGFDFPYPWPLWVMGPWGVVLLVTTIATGLGGKRNP
ncbi:MULTISPECIES: DUF1707 SHOCT-like domain-containing protein [Streptosporangium]|uniref:DUF1707 domain-containing protein n=1 Tax=Streptosporangium brasiliense TaxID=47480 RepID=A0ABT9R1D4_9ACTN|nr:DUF1707 domain-containing protein [Streptosporangium brasiliense]MDP9863038.1 hypothetical protein [Streptosporangium brasiliense]